MTSRVKKEKEKLVILSATANSYIHNLTKYMLINRAQHLQFIAIYIFNNLLLEEVCYIVFLAWRQDNLAI